MADQVGAESCAIDFQTKSVSALNKKIESSNSFSVFYLVQNQFWSVVFILRLSRIIQILPTAIYNRSLGFYAILISRNP